MEQPSNGGEATKEEVATAAAAGEKISGQETVPGPKPDPISIEANGDQQNKSVTKNEEKNEINNNASVTTGTTNSNNSTEKKINTEIKERATSGGDPSAASPLSSKAKKSVRWREELVSESPRQRMLSSQCENRGSNPYVAYAPAPAPSSSSSSINFKG